jgi:hypothetical protein
MVNSQRKQTIQYARTFIGGHPTNQAAQDFDVNLTAIISRDRMLAATPGDNRNYSGIC